MSKFVHIFEGKFKFVALKKTMTTPLFSKVYKIKIAYFFTLYMGYFIGVFDFNSPSQSSLLNLQILAK